MLANLLMEAAGLAHSDSRTEPHVLLTSRRVQAANVFCARTHRATRPHAWPHWNTPSPLLVGCPRDARPGCMVVCKLKGQHHISPGSLTGLPSGMLERKPTWNWSLHSSLTAA